MPLQIPTLMKNEKLKQQIVSYALLVLGSALFAVGDVMFVNPYHMAPGGVYGLANVFNAMWGWKISLAGVCMDIPLLIIGTIILGPRFGIKTVISVILIPVFTYIVETFWGYAPVIHDGVHTIVDHRGHDARHHPCATNGTNQKKDDDRGRTTRNLCRYLFL